MWWSKYIIKINKILLRKLFRSMHIVPFSRANFKKQVSMRIPHGLLIEKRLLWETSAHASLVSRIFFLPLYYNLGWYFDKVCKLICLKGRGKQEGLVYSQIYSSWDRFCPSSNILFYIFICAYELHVLQPRSHGLI